MRYFYFIAILYLMVGTGEIIYCYPKGVKYALLIQDEGFFARMAKYFKNYTELSKKSTGYKIGNNNEIVASHDAWRASR